MIVSSAALAATIGTVADKLGAALPPGFAEAVAASRALPGAADALGGNIPALHHAALDALAADEDPADNRDVQRLAIHSVLASTGLRQAAEQRAGSDIRAAIAEYSDDILEVWAGAVSADCDVLSTAAAELNVPDLDAADTTALRQRGQLNLWADASSAAERADLALAGCEAVLTALAIDHNKAQRALLLAPDIDLPSFSALNAKATAWDVARTGAPLRVASIGDYTAAIGRLTAERQALQRQAEAEREAAQRAARGQMPPARRRADTPLPERIG